jgi:hypothetical protein
MKPSTQYKKIWTSGYYNNERTHQGTICCGQTPIDTLIDGKRIWKEKSF